jgi:YVTN family beta-propeller protein
VKVSFTFTAPLSTTYYCATVDDGSSPPSEVVSSSQVFTIEPLMGIQTPALSTNNVEVLSPLYEGNPITATVTWSGGTGPYDVFFYQDLGGAHGCVLTTLVATGADPNPKTGVTTTSATFHFLAPNTVGDYYYCAVVTDGITTVTSTDVKLSVASYLGSVNIVLAPSSGIDQGQTEPMTATVSWAGGSAPYSVTLYSGTSLSCSADTTKVGTNSGISTTSTTFSFASPSVTTQFCATVSDASVPASVNSGGPQPFSVASPPKLTLPSSYAIEAGQGTSITATIVSPGIAPDTVTWYLGSTCSGGALATGLTYNTGVLSQPTTYSALLTDSSPGTPKMTSCATITIGINNGPLMIAAVNSGPYAGMVFAVCTSPEEVHSICVLNSDSLSEVGIIPILSDAWGNALNPWGVAIDPSPPATINGGDSVVWVTGQDSVNSGGNLCWISIATSSVGNCYKINAATAYNPEGVAVNTATHQVFVANNDHNTVSVFDEASTTFNEVAVGAGPMMVAVDPNTYNVYVTDNAANTITVMTPKAPAPYTWSVTTVTVGVAPVGVVVDPATGNVWVANSGDGTVSVISGTTFATLHTIKVGDSPNGIDLDTATNVAYVAMNGVAGVTTINMGTFAPSASSIAVGSGPFDVAYLFNPANPLLPDLVFVTNSGSNTVSVINAATNAVVATIIIP